MVLATTFGLQLDIGPLVELFWKWLSWLLITSHFFGAYAVAVVTATTKKAVSHYRYGFCAVEQTLTLPGIDSIYNPDYRKYEDNHCMSQARGS